MWRLRASFACCGLCVRSQSGRFKLGAAAQANTLAMADSNGEHDRPRSVAFCHLDLGVGGAERFIVDSAREVQEAGHTVHLYTSHYDTSRCDNLRTSTRPQVRSAHPRARSVCPCTSNKI